MTLRRIPAVKNADLRVTSRVDVELKHGRIHAAPCCVWLTGLSGSGKTTLAYALRFELLAGNFNPFVIGSDLGFSAADRIENVRRISELACLLVDGGLIAIVACISPFEAERQAVRGRFPPHQFLEVYLDTPLHVCEARDCKGLYAKARSGVIAEFTGISSPYEPPSQPELQLDASGAQSPGELARVVLERLLRRTTSA